MQPRTIDDYCAHFAKLGIMGNTPDEIINFARTTLKGTGVEDNEENIHTFLTFCYGKEQAIAEIALNLIFEALTGKGSPIMQEHLKKTLSEAFED